MPDVIVKKLVMIESPFNGTEDEIQRNIIYARYCVEDSLSLNESPFASHVFYAQTGILDDYIPAERKLGIESGFAWGLHANLIAVYIDFGISDGMKEAIDYYMSINVPITYRNIPEQAGKL